VQDEKKNVLIQSDHLSKPLTKNKRNIFFVIVHLF